MTDQRYPIQSARRALEGAALRWEFIPGDPRNGFRRYAERDGVELVQASATCHEWGWWVSIEWTDAPGGRIAAGGKLPSRRAAMLAAYAAMFQLKTADIPAGLYDITTEGMQPPLRGNLAAPPPPAAARVRVPQRRDMPAGGLFDDDARRQLALF